MNIYKKDSYDLQLSIKEHLDWIPSFTELNYSEESKKKLEEEIRNFENKINNLDNIKQNIITEINKLKESKWIRNEIYKIIII